MGCRPIRMKAHHTPERSAEFGVYRLHPYIKPMSRYDYEKLAVIHPAGTVLETEAYGLIRHVGIATGYGTVIHASRRYGGVLETSEKLFSRGKPIRVIPHNSPLSGTELVVRARQKIGQRYGVLTRNCEHFVQWVVAGEPRSEQLGPLDLGRI